MQPPGGALPERAPDTSGRVAWVSFEVWVGPRQTGGESVPGLPPTIFCEGTVIKERPNEAEAFWSVLPRGLKQ